MPTFLDLSSPPPEASPTPTPSPGSGSSRGTFLDLAQKPPAPQESGGIIGAGKASLSALGRALDAQRYGLAKATTGESDTGKQLEKQWAALGVTPQERAQEPGWYRGLTDFAMQTVTDPLTYETLGLGAGVKLAGKAVEGIKNLARLTPLGRGIEDYATWGGKAARELGPEAALQARGAANVGSATAARVAGHFNRRFETITKGLSDNDLVDVGKALNGELLPEELDPKLRPAYRQLRTLTALDFKLRSQAHGVPGFDMPGGFRQNYFPGTHMAEEVAKDQPKHTFNLLDPFDPRTIEREELNVTDPEQVRAGFGGMAKNAGRQVGAQKIRDFLGDLIDKPQIRELFDVTTPATGKERSNWQQVAEGFKSLVGYPRAAIISFLPRHGVNILDMVANTAPELLPRIGVLAAKLAVAGPKDYERLTAPGRALGGLTGAFAERKPYFANVPGVGAITRFNTKLVWAIDDAAKQEYALHLLRTGEATEKTAGGMAAKRLVDYANVPKMTEHARYVMPFASFRTQIPGAVLGGVARNPARAAAINRLTGGTVYGGTQPTPLGTLETFNPTADVGRALDTKGMAGYLRASLGQPAQAAATFLQEREQGGPGAYLTWDASKSGGKYADQVKLRAARYMTYGDPLDLKWLVNAAAAGVPEAGLALDTLHLGEFRRREPDTGTYLGKEALRQALGLGISR